MAWKRSLLPWLGPGILGGISLGDWWRLLQANQFSISPRHLPRALTITAHAIPNSVLRGWETWKYGRELKAVDVQPPLFLLGHWRNGTTLLHNLISIDSRFAFPNTYQALFPHAYLTTEGIGSRLLALFLPKSRPMDNVEMGGSTPQEDEFALSVLSLESPLLGWVFPNRRAFYDKYLTMRDVSETERVLWRDTFMQFLQKLTFKYNRPLVLKSPPHTARIRLLLGMFPSAKFVHIHRNPFTVFQSSRRMFGVNFAIDGLQRLARADLDEWILRQYRAMYDAYFAERDLIPKGRLCEVAFELLESDPIGELRRIYQELDLPDFGKTEVELRRYVASIADYQKNVFAPLPANLQRQIVEAWQPCFEEWDYPRVAAEPEQPISAATSSLP